MRPERDRPRLQPLTRARVASLGPAGAAWLDRLPQVLTELAAAWELTLGRPLGGGSASYVTRAYTRPGVEVVLKVAVSSAGLADQAAVLERAYGRGYARLLAADLTRQALLLEALGAPLERSGRTPPHQLAVLADTLGAAWQAPPAGQEPVAKAEGLRELIDQAWPRLGRPCSERVLVQALGYLNDLANVPPRDLVVVHGDPHPGNALAARSRPGAETGYCFVDPDGFVGDRAYDLGVAVRDWSSRLDGTDARRLLEGYCRLVADRAGADVERVWQWGYVERVSTGLYVMSLGGSGAERLGRTFLAAAEWLAT